MPFATVGPAQDPLGAMFVLNLLPLTHALSLSVGPFFNDIMQPVTAIVLCGSLLLMVHLLPLKVTDWQHLQASPKQALAVGTYPPPKPKSTHRAQSFN